MISFPPAKPSGNIVAFNIALLNPVDILWDKTGTRNLFGLNLCRVTNVAGACLG